VSNREVPAGHGPHQLPAKAARTRIRGLDRSDAQHSPADFAFSIVSFHEQVLGGHALLNRARTSADLIRGYAFLLEIFQSYITTPVLPFDAAAAAIFDGLHAQKIRVATMDLRIAAIALSQGLTLLTRNVSDSGRVPGLVTED